ncbi:unnamed protein product [Blepharisma stoltei]|uniref:CHHC U11-48K-type domain-containing protein n=1 Tax=Blepharisma stoltei TaxID=1481888 RepID=A0AAU9JZR0_9CILI|nr:unnamed protein product [Blepharisma stoltei]
MINSLEPKIACSYNPDHLVNPARLLWHYTKCPDRKHMSQMFKICPYNPAHHIPNCELYNHMKRCPNAKVQLKLNFRNDEDPWG